MMSNGIFISILVEYSWNTVEHGPSTYMIYDDLLNLNMVMFQFAISSLADRLEGHGFENVSNGWKASIQ